MRAPVRRATPADADQVAEILTDGFAGDPVQVWIYRTDAQYRRLAPAFFRWVTERTLTLGEVYLAGEGWGAMLSQLSSTVDIPAEDDRQIQQQLRVVGAECADRLLSFMNASHENHPLDTPHWYCSYVAVRPEHRSQGIGSALLRRALAEKSLPCYLESSCARNRALYERLGFRATGEFAVADGVSLSKMWHARNAEPRA